MPLRKQAFFASLKSNPIAPYVIHSVEYGNEPLTDHFQDEATYLQDFKDIKKQLAEYDIPATLSESFGALKAFSAFDELANEVDLFHSQIMPMYEEGVAYATDSWSFWSSEAQQWLDIADGRQIMATVNYMLHIASEDLNVDGELCRHSGHAPPRDTAAPLAHLAIALAMLNCKRTGICWQTSVTTS